MSIPAVRCPACMSHDDHHDGILVYLQLCKHSAERVRKTPFLKEASGSGSSHVQLLMMTSKGPQARQAFSSES